MDQTTGRGIITVVDHNGLQVIFRISTGLTIALPVKCFFVEQPAFQITMVLICFGWGILFLFLFCWLSTIHN